MKQLKRQTDRLWKNVQTLSDQEFIQLDALSLATGLKPIFFNLSDDEKAILEDHIKNATQDSIEALTFLDKVVLHKKTSLARLRLCLKGELGENATQEAWEFIFEISEAFRTKIDTLI
jgi:hypothetical protein